MHSHYTIPAGGKQIVIDRSTTITNTSSSVASGAVPINATEQVTLFSDVSGSKSSSQYSRTWLQNVGANPCNVSLNATATASTYDIILPANMFLPFELTPFLGLVSAYSALGTTVCAIRYVNLDIAPAQGSIIRNGQESTGF